MKWVIFFLFLLALLYFSGEVKVLREIRNNNPLGLMDNGSAWIGKIGVDPKGMIIFDTSIHGIRAGLINIIHKQTRRDAKNLREIFAGYTTDYADPEKYAREIDYFSPSIYSIDEPIDVKNYLYEICIAVIRAEMSLNPYPDSIIQEGVQEALKDA